MNLFHKFLYNNKYANDGIREKNIFIEDVSTSCKTFVRFKGSIATHINQINYVKVHIWVHSVTVIKKNESLGQMLLSTVKIMPRTFDLYIGRMGGPSKFSVAKRKTL